MASSNETEHAVQPPKSGIGSLMGSLVMIIAALAAGGSTLLTLGKIMPVYDVPEELKNLPTPAPTEKLAELDREMQIKEMCNSTLALGIFGALLGLTIGVAEGLLAQSPSRIIMVGVVGIVGGCTLGAAAGFVGVHFTRYCEYASYVDSKEADKITMWFKSTSPLMRNLMIQASSLGLMGLGVGMIAVFWKTPLARVQGIFGGALAGVLGALFYVLLTATIYPVANTSTVLPEEGVSRLMWLGCSTGLIGLVLGGMRET